MSQQDRERAEAFRRRVREAIDRADRIFWARIAEGFPEAGSDLLPSEARKKWDRISEESVYTWLMWNFPGGEEILRDIAKL